MRMSSFLTAAAFAVSLAASTGAMAADFSGVPEWPQQQALVPADPPGQPQVQHLQLQNPQASPYDSADFVVPPYDIHS